jgi:uncharacterized protein YndB with AHSA1/START domain
MRTFMQASPSAAPASTDRIEKIVNLEAAPSRVWRAITDHEQFGQWFGMKLDGPFTPGTIATGKLNSPKYAHLPVKLWVEALEPERYFAYRWHPYALEEGVDYDAEPTTLISFTLEPVGTGTRLTIVESGFDAIPESRRALAFSMDEKGWAAQAENIRKFVGG